MKMAVAWAAVAAAAHAAAACHLPERFRGGQLEKAVCGEAPQTVDLPTGHIYHAPMDHFNDSVTGTIPVRYWLDKSCHRPGGPVFVYMGGEGPQLPSMCVPGSPGAKHNAALLSVEHRFYGQSLPTGPKPLSDSNLRYLSADQNLADTNAITTSIKKELGATKAMAFGCSYSGGTCAWFRQKYPDTVDGCIAKSGVVNTIYDFHQYDAKCYKALTEVTPDCSRKVILGTQALERAFAAGEGDNMKKRFGAPKLIGTKLGDYDFFYGAADAIAGLDQYGNKLVACDQMAKLPENPTDEELIQNLIDLINTNYAPGFMAGCFYNSDCVKYTNGTDMTRSWRWQKCTNVGYLQTAPSVNSLRSTKYVSVDALSAQCEYIFGFTPDQQRAKISAFTQSHYGTITSSSQIFFYEYSDDQWQAASMMKQLTPELPMCLSTCTGCGHCGSGAGNHTAACTAEANTYLEKWLS